MSWGEWVHPPFISEREVAHTWPDGTPDDARWEDCVFMAGLRQYLGAVPGGAPATHREGEAIRAAAGLSPSGPASSDDLLRGTAKRYGWSAKKIGAGISPLRAELVSGAIATASGRLSNFPKGHRLRRFQPDFTGGHRVSVENYGTGKLWWADPLGPKTGYDGEWVTWAELETFVSGGSSQTVARLANAPKEDAVYPIITHAPGSTVVVKPTASIRKAPGPLDSTTLIRYVKAGAAEKHVAIGSVQGYPDPTTDNSKEWWCWWAGDHFEYTHRSNVTQVLAPVADCTAAINAAVAKATDPLKAEIASMAARINTKNAKAKQASALLADALDD